MIKNIKSTFLLVFFNGAISKSKWEKVLLNIGGVFFNCAVSLSKWKKSTTKVNLFLE